MNDGEWVKLEVVERLDGRVQFSRPGEGLLRTGQVDLGAELVLFEGTSTAVRFPNGSVRLVRIVARRTLFRCTSDCLSSCLAIDRWGCWADLDGVQVWVPLEAVEVPRNRFLTQREAEATAAEKRKAGR